ncbi:MAG: biopolymer transport protein ExbB [Acetobacteraceae bacterium]|nr:biopolymer transport protein ExbB [Acetobacteraceae bacterium]
MIDRLAWCGGRAGRAGIFTVVLWCVCCMLAQPANAWWNGDWSFRMKITADAGAKGANLTDPIGRTQVLIRLHSGNFNFASAKDDGTDLRFVAADDRTPLHYHIERFDGLVDQVGLIWVDVPDLAPGVATPIYMYWGNKNAGNASDSRATYDADQLLVYHFSEDNGLPKDATGYGNNALTAGKHDTGALIGYGERLDGTAPIRLPQSPSLGVTASETLTWSLWIHPDAGANTAILYSDRDGPNALTIGLDQGVAYAQIDTPDGPKRTSPGAPMTGDGWHLVAVTATPDHLTVYLDGQARGDVVAALPGLAGQAVLGGALPVVVTAPAAPDAPAAAPGTPATSPPPTPAQASPAATGDQPPAVPLPLAAPPPNFVGELDEFELSKVVRQHGALQLAVASQGPDPKLLTFDVAEQASVFGSGYVGIIVRAVSPDAWVIIGLLGVMSLISWWVMLGKALYLSRVSRANERFRAGLRQVRAAHGNQVGYGDLSGMPPDVVRSSPLYRLYQIGNEELNERLHGGLTQDNGMLAPQSIAAIRSAVNAAMAQENQRLSRMMIMLTIAISGGPFLGLLGTVVGVMITFAAVAQAGDVNINAIAPGISAALLATVAGLAVAIPALFGYNYLLSRVREIATDMAAFVDTMVTRLGEGVRAPLAKAAE